MAGVIGGKTEVSTEAGRIDVLTRRHVIEVKTAENWKHALGQVLVYQSYYPGHEPVVFLIGDTEPYLGLARSHYRRWSVRVVVHISELVMETAA